MNDAPTQVTISCDSCALAAHIRMQPTDIQTKLVCKAMPPQPVAMLIQTPEGIVTQIQSLFPMVNNQTWCFMHRGSLHAKAAGADPSSVKVQGEPEKPRPVLHTVK